MKYEARKDKEIFGIPGRNLDFNEEGVIMTIIALKVGDFDQNKQANKEV